MSINMPWHAPVLFKNIHSGHIVMVVEQKIYKNKGGPIMWFCWQKDALLYNFKDVPSFTMCTIKIMKGYKQN